MTKIRCRFCDVQKLTSFYNVHLKNVSEKIESLIGIKLICHRNISNWICSKCYFDIAEACETQQKIIQVELKHKEELTCLEDQDELASINSDGENNLDELTSKRYSCNKCLQRFQKLMEFVKHLQNHFSIQEKSQILCEDCGATFNNLNEYDIHKKTVHPGDFFILLTNWNEWKISLDAYTCTVCSDVCATLDDLSEHLKKKGHNSKPFVCDVCNTKFAQKFDLQEHTAQHVETHPFQCRLCFCRFKYAASLNIHQRIRHLDTTQTA